MYAQGGTKGTTAAVVYVGPIPRTCGRSLGYCGRPGVLAVFFAGPVLSCGGVLTEQGGC